MRSPGFSPHSSAGLSERETRSVAGNHTSVRNEQKLKNNSNNLKKNSSRLNEVKKSEQTAVTWRGGDSWPHCRLFAKPISRSDECCYIRKQCCQNNNSKKRKIPHVESLLRAIASSCGADCFYFFYIHLTDSGCGASGPFCTPRGHETDSESPRVRGSSPLLCEGSEDRSR